MEINEDYKLSKAKGHYQCQPLVKRIEQLEADYKKLEAFVQWIARDYVELSHDKVRIQRDYYIKRAKQLVNELYE